MLTANAIAEDFVPSESLRDSDSGAISREAADRGGGMDDSKFSMLKDMLRVLEHSHNPAAVESAMELVEEYNAALSQEQKAEILKTFLQLRHHQSAHDVEHERRLEQELEREQMERFRKIEIVD